MSVSEGTIFLHNFSTLAEPIKKNILAELHRFGVVPHFSSVETPLLVVPQFVGRGAGRKNLAPIIGKLLQTTTDQSLAWKQFWHSNAPPVYPTEIDFTNVERHANAFAAQIERSRTALVDILLDYESYDVALDEIRRALDLLMNIRENEQYFRREVKSVVVFLPRNQPLYAFCCFALVPSLMSSEVFVRPPLVMHGVISNVVGALDLRKYFPNVSVSFQERASFINERLNAGNTDVVIFTGTMQNADRVRKMFPSSTLFIANGSGHNPLVIGYGANLENAIDSVLRIQLYNSGQDCANANSILVHRERYEEFVSLLRDRVAGVSVGQYRHVQNRVGPLTDRRELTRIQKFLTENSQWLDSSTEGVIRTKSVIVEPAIFLKPLRHGGNYIEHFAPFFMVQRYEEDLDLCEYFENPRYELNAMYVTVFGNSAYVDSLPKKVFSGGKRLHDSGTIIRNTDLLGEGVERGTQPFGGYGRAASCLSLNRHVLPMPTCPQRDIYDCLVAPGLFL